MNKVSKQVAAIARRGTCLLPRNYGTVQAAQLQEAAMEERCILVDDTDRNIGEASKRQCHRVGPDGKLLLHRAFSVFLFNRKGELLLHKRSPTKITFPHLYTNSCCSHPLAEIPGETEELNGLGVRRAAQRRLNFELGIPTSEVSLSDFVYVTRIHYECARGYWGEHELDHVMFLQKDDPTLNPNPDEISEIHWVGRSEINDFVHKEMRPLTPWFELIYRHRLPLWWDNLNSLEKVQDHHVIHRFPDN